MNFFPNFPSLLSHVGKIRFKRSVLYTITFITMFVPTYSVWYVILFQETGVVHQVTHIFSYYLLICYLIQRKGVLYKVKSKSRFIQIARSLALTHIAFVRDSFLPRLPASVIGCQPLSRLDFSPYHPSYLLLTVPEHTLPA
jgi:hypothetical protein